MPGDPAAGRQLWTEMLGATHVNKERSRDPATQKLMAMAEETVWGDIWLRPELGRRERSLITIALLIAQDKQAELGRHVGGALANGCTPAEILEVAVHTSVYLGVPTAIAAATTMTAALGPERLAEMEQK
jgi:alkylhydroperoxidase/carboxymuconolactone decarboxylase family protein YurZ